MYLASYVASSELLYRFEVLAPLLALRMKKRKERRILQQYWSSIISAYARDQKNWETTTITGQRLYSNIKCDFQVFYPGFVETDRIGRRYNHYFYLKKSVRT